MHKLDLYKKLTTKNWLLDSKSEKSTIYYFFHKNINKRSFKYFFHQVQLSEFLNKEVITLTDMMVEFKKNLAFLKIPEAHDNKYIGLYFLIKNKDLLNKSLNSISNRKNLLDFLKKYKEYLRLIFYQNSKKDTKIFDCLGLINLVQIECAKWGFLRKQSKYVYRKFLKTTEVLKRASWVKYNDIIRNSKLDDTYYDRVLYSYAEKSFASIWTPVKFKSIDLRKPWKQKGLYYYNKLIFQFTRFSLLYSWMLQDIKDMDVLKYNQNLKTFMFLKKVIDNFWEVDLLLEEVTLDTKLDTLFFFLKNLMKRQQKSGTKFKKSLKKRFEFMIYTFHMLNFMKKAKTWTPMKRKKLLNKYLYRSRGLRFKFMWKMLKNTSFYMKQYGLNSVYGKYLETIFEDVFRRLDSKRLDRMYEVAKEEYRKKQIYLENLKAAYLRKGKVWVDKPRKKPTRLSNLKFKVKRRRLTSLQYWGFNWFYKNINYLKKNPEIYSSMRKEQEVVGHVELSKGIYKYGEAYLTLRKTYSNLFLQIAVFDEFTRNEKIFFVESLGQAAGFGNKKFKNKKKKRNVELLKFMVIDAMRKMASYGIRKIIIRNVDKLFFYQKKTLRYMLRRGGFNIVGHEFIYKKPHGKGLRKKKLRRL